MDFKSLRWLFILPVAIFVGVFEWVRHYPLHNYLESIFPGWQENFFSVILMMVIIAVFSHRLFLYIKRLNQELLTEREKLRLIIEHSVDAIVVLGLDKTFNTVNPAASRLLGWQVDELVQRYHCEKVLRCHDRNGNSACDLDCLLDNTVSTGIQSSDMEVNICNREGQSIPVSLSCSEIPSNQGQENAVVLVIRDMREKKRLEEELEAIAKINSGTLGHGPLGDVLQGLVNKIIQMTEVDFVVYNGIQDDHGLRVVAGAKLSEAAQKYINQIEDATVKTHKMEALAGEGLALVSYPVHCGEKLSGLIICGRIGVNSFAIAEMNTLNRLVKQVVMVIENFLLYRQVQDGATLDERYRLAREIHDGLSQGLGYLNLRSKVIENYLTEGQVKEAIGEIREVREVVKDLYQEARTSIFDLKLNPATGEGIATFLKNYLSKFENQTTISTKLVLPNEPIKLTQKTELHMIRIIQEALANIRKHAQATSVEVVLVKNPASLKVEVRDNGVGLTAVKDNRTHFGLAIMDERAAIIGADISIAPGELGGTVVAVELPVDKGGDGYGPNQSIIS
ncbi:MAG: PAS domain-containing sensor histidine kinase [Clostridia bacterium]|nr:PAS domain-containing sensor histidine kinase [Clostridia bacterium]